MADFYNPGSKATRTYIESVQIAIGGTYSITIDTLRMTKLLPMLRQTYAATHATTTGVTVTRKFGLSLDNADVAPVDATTATHKGTGERILFADSEDPVSQASMPAVNTGTPQTKVNEWAETVGDKQRFILYTFTNTDVTNPATINFYATV